MELFYLKLIQILLRSRPSDCVNKEYVYNLLFYNFGVVKEVLSKTFNRSTHKHIHVCIYMYAYNSLNNYDSLIIKKG